MEVLGGTSHDGVYYYTSDALGSVRTVSGIDGAARCVYDYDSFGLKFDAGTRMDFVQRYTYTGRETSVLSGAPMFFRNRLYSAGLGRFLRQDPSGFINNPDGNLYAYVGNNPVMFSDPMGLCGERGDSAYERFTKQLEELQRLRDEHRESRLAKIKDFNDSMNESEIISRAKSHYGWYLLGGFSEAPPKTEKIHYMFQAVDIGDKIGWVFRNRILEYEELAKFENYVAEFSDLTYKVKVDYSPTPSSISNAVNDPNAVSIFIFGHGVYSEIYGEYLPQVILKPEPKIETELPNEEKELLLTPFDLPCYKRKDRFAANPDLEVFLYSCGQDSFENNPWPEAFGIKPSNFTGYKGKKTCFYIL